MLSNNPLSPRERQLLSQHRSLTRLICSLKLQADEIVAELRTMRATPHPAPGRAKIVPFPSAGGAQ